MHFDWLNREAAGFKSHAAVSIKTKQDLNQETWKVVIDPLPHSSKRVRVTAAEEQTTQRKMKAVVVFLLLFAAVYCHPVKRSASSSESADVQPVDTQALKVTAVADVSSEEDDDDADDDDDDNDSDESDENGGPTSSPPIIETTLINVINGRGDSIGYQSDYKKPIYYVDGNNIDKGPSSYKSYGSDKTKYDGVDLKVYKALQVHNVGLDQGVDASSGTDSDDMSQQEQKAASTSTASDAIHSQESDEDSQSSEEDTTAATTTDSISSESNESEETNTADQPALLKSENPEVIIA
ncbi:osteopontin [Pangasianodon hypophthalmus]|uniref:osteopontin n=1 Tax=Pangasianodon hypophthalmus TaxID=310915 RepID=UPI002307D45E|nr:osteopontin [Pangasianodon hypophthalmus]